MRKGAELWDGFGYLRARTDWLFVAGYIVDATRKPPSYLTIYLCRPLHMSVSWERHFLHSALSRPSLQTPQNNPHVSTASLRFGQVVD